MSAELMKSKFDRRPSSVRLSVCGAVISECNARISLKFWLLLPLGHTLGPFCHFCKKKFFFDFLLIFLIFVHMGPYGSQNFKMLLLLQITAESFQTFAEFSFQWSSQNCIWDFWNLENWHFTVFFSFSLTWDPMGVKISKHYSPYKLQPKVFKLFLNFLPIGPHKNTLGIFEILSLRFLMCFFPKFQFHHCTRWRNQKPQLSGKTSES